MTETSSAATRPEPQVDDGVRCRGCGREVTRRRLAIEVAGGHEHRFRNPAGWSFQVVCFTDAPGCRADGTLTDAHTWFAGYAWNFALCGGCGGHLGWWFVSGRHSFVGLIATRLR